MIQVRYAPARSASEHRLRMLLHLLLEAGWRCCFCFARLDLSSATREHMLPRSLGGSSAFDNLTVSCHYCNCERGVEDFWEFEGRTPKRPRAWAAPHPTRAAQLRASHG